MGVEMIDGWRQVMREENSTEIEVKAVSKWK
jgi:hypothetical protein